MRNNRFLPTHLKRLKTFQTMTYNPYSIFSCQNTLKKAKFLEFGIKNANLATLHFVSGWLNIKSVLLFRFHSFLVTTFIQTARISLAPIHVSRYQAFRTGLSYLMLNLQLTKISQQSKTARHCRTRVKISIVIVILRSKQYYRVVTVLIKV